MRFVIIVCSLMLSIGVYADTVIAPATATGTGISSANSTSASGAVSTSDASSASTSGSDASAGAISHSGGNTQGTTTSITTVIPAPLPRQTSGVCPENYVPLFNIITGQVNACVPMPKR